MAFLYYGARARTPTFNPFYDTAFMLLENLCVAWWMSANADMMKTFFGAI
jgi:hypothetical protein